MFSRPISSYLTVYDINCIGIYLKKIEIVTAKNCDTTMDEGGNVQIRIEANDQIFCETKFLDDTEFNNFEVITAFEKCAKKKETKCKNFPLKCSKIASYSSLQNLCI